MLTAKFDAFNLWIKFEDLMHRSTLAISVALNDMILNTGTSVLLHLDAFQDNNRLSSLGPSSST